MTVQARDDLRPPPMLRARSAVRAWLTANTLMPSWLPVSWRHPLLGYLLAALCEAGAALAVAILVQTVPFLRSMGTPLLLVVVLLALIWGAGPGLVATLVGGVAFALMLIYPLTQVALTGPQTVATVLQFVIFGAVASVLAGQSQRRRMEAQALARAMAAERARLEAIIEAMSDGVAVYDTEARLVQTNSALRAALGYEKHPDVLEQPLAERLSRLALRTEDGQAIPAEQWPQLRLLRGAVLTGAQTHDVLIRRLDGVDRVFNLSGAPIGDRNGAITGAVMVYRDVTERRRLERRTHEALDALLEMAQTLVTPPTGAAETGEGSPHVSAHIQAVGHRLVTLTQRLLDCHLLAMVGLDPQTGVQQVIAVAGITPHDEQAWRAVTEGVSLFTAQNPLTAALVAHLRGGEIAVVDMSQPPFDTNPYGARSLLLVPLRSGDDLIGYCALAYGPEDHTFAAEERALAAAVGRFAAFTLERERLIREREEARVNTLAWRQASERMDEFLALASHELRAPLTSLLGLVQLARRRLRRTEAMEAPVVAELFAQVQEHLHQAEAQARRLNRLIGDLVDVTRVQSGRFTLELAPADLRDIVRESVDEQRAAWPRRTLTLDLPAEEVRVQADGDRLRQVITNYLSNALKYSPPDQPVAVLVRAEATAAWVGVRDRGPGLTPAQQEEVWESYRRVEGMAVADPTGLVGGNLGLGLYISRTIIDQHGGQVGVESAPGAGALFWFTVPLGPPA